MALLSAADIAPQATKDKLMEVTISRSNYTFVDVSNWLDQLDRVYDNAKASMWHFAATLAAGIDQFGRTDPRKRELYEMASHQLGLAVTTLQTYVSAVRSPVASLAIEKDLSFQHARAVLGLSPDVADDLLSQAVANGWSAERLSNRAWAERNVPSQRTLNSTAATYESPEVDDVPFSHADQPDGSATYDNLWTDERISSMVAQHQRGDFVPAADACRLLRTMRDEYETAISRR